MTLTRPTSCQWWCQKWHLSVSAHSQTSCRGWETGYKNHTGEVNVLWSYIDCEIRVKDARVKRSVSPVLVKVEWNISEVRVVVQEDLFQIRITNYLLPPTLIHQVNDDLKKTPKSAVTGFLRFLGSVKSEKININFITWKKKTGKQA